MTLETGSGYELVVNGQLSVVSRRAQNLVVSSMGSALSAGVGRGDSIEIFLQLTTDNWRLTTSSNRPCLVGWSPFLVLWSD
jgi:hypothetical protein